MTAAGHRAQPGTRTEREAAAKSVLEGPAMLRPLAELLLPLGLEPASWSHVRSHHRPGAGVSALYRVQVRTRPGAAAARDEAAGAETAAAGNRPPRVFIGATTAALDGAARAASLSCQVAGTELRLWLHPRDPGLPALRWATDAAAVAHDVFGAADGRAGLKLVAYRPLRRAVVRAVLPLGGAGPDRELIRYLKLPPPRQAAALKDRHRLLAAAGLPVPGLHRLHPGADSAGADVLVLDSLPGTSLRKSLAAGEAGTLDPVALTGLLDRLPRQLLAFPRKAPWAERVLDYGAAASVALPAERAAVTDLAREIHAAVGAADPGPAAPTHGDFHAGNILVAGSGSGLDICGLLDIDAAGPGHRVDDLACFLGHLAVQAALAGLSAPGAGHRRQEAAVGHFGSAWSARGAEPAALYARAAGVALTLVAGADQRTPGGARAALSAARELLRRGGLPAG